MYAKHASPATEAGQATKLHPPITNRPDEEWTP